MGFTNAGQLQELFLCGGAGFLLGVYYDVFRLWRLWFPSRMWAVFVQDCLFFVTSAVALFLLVLAVTDGEMRFYVYVGVVGGFFAYRHTVGRWCLRAAAFLRRFIKKILAFAVGFMRRGLSAIKKGVKNLKKTKKGLETETGTIV